MKTKRQWILSFGMAGVFGASLVAEPSQTELMKQAKVTRAEAEMTALGIIPNGKIQSEEIETEQHALMWSFDIITPNRKNITEVLVNAKTGWIIFLNVETPAD